MDANFWHIFLTGAAAVAVLFFVMWVIHLALKNAAIVDVGWGLGFVLLCLIAVTQGAGFTLRNTLCLIMISLWGLRIVFFLLKRIAAEKQEDKRYQKIRKEFGRLAWLKFLIIFEFQAALELVIGLPILLTALNPRPGLSWIEGMGAVIFILALIGEALADEQLHAFKQDPRHKGEICQEGLWYYSRHPNYFFEWLVWVGLFIYSLPNPGGWAGIVSPLTMYYLLMYVSGVPMAEEQSLASRGEKYKVYQATTSMFFPMPKKRMAS